MKTEINIKQGGAKASLYLIILLLLICGYFLYGKYQNAQKEVVRLETNNTILDQQNKEIRGKSGELAISLQALTLKVSELKDNEEYWMKKAKSLSIRTKDIKSVSTVATKTDVQIQAPIERLKDTLPHVRSFKYEDNWNLVTGLIYPDTVKIRIQGTDSLYIFNHIEKHKFLFIRWGKKAEWWTVENTNPFNKIVGFSVKQILH